MSTSDFGLRATTIILVAISAMWMTTFAAAAFGIHGAPTLAAGALAAFAASATYARMADREMPRPRRALGPER